VALFIFIFRIIYRQVTIGGQVSNLLMANTGYGVPVISYFVGAVLADTTGGEV
jgi:hypothetical protein